MARSTVLIVDDDPDQHTVCGVFLEHSGYRVLHAFDGQEGVQIAREEQPDLVLMDIRMRRMDGVAARRALAADPSTAAIPVVAVSADVLTWPERRVLDEGFAGHISKPCNLHRIGGLVRALIRPRQFVGVVAGSALAV
ncbi:response regulator [Longimicrobium sp.]|uniref:response regulator n=1 Tax=Longimicrobium sp. TaxID=2029185 RepID=UPI003B3AE38C